MFPAKRLSGFFLRCVLYYGLLVVPWPGLIDGYRAFFRAGGNLLFKSFSDGGSVSFEPLSSHDHAKDTRLVLRKTKPLPVSGDMDIKSVYVGYRPTIFLIALVLAAPVPWSRRLWALWWGLVLVNAFVAFRVWLQLVNAYSDPNALNLYPLSPFWKGMLRAAVLVLFRAPAAHYVVPMFIWMLVTFRRGDLQGMFAGRKKTAGGKAGQPRQAIP